MIQFFTPVSGRAIPYIPDRTVTGYLPGFFDEADPRPAREQIATNYLHGGGWNPMDGMTIDRDYMAARYPGDPPYRTLAVARLRNERLYLFEHEWLAIVQPDGSFEIARVN